MSAGHWSQLIFGCERVLGSSHPSVTEYRFWQDSAACRRFTALHRSQPIVNGRTASSTTGWPSCFRVILHMHEEIPVDGQLSNFATTHNRHHVKADQE